MSGTWNFDKAATIGYTVGNRLRPLHRDCVVLGPMNHQHRACDLAKSVRGCTGVTKPTFVPSDATIGCRKMGNLGIEHGVVHHETMTKEQWRATAATVLIPNVNAIYCFGCHDADPRLSVRPKQTNR